MSKSTSLDGVTGTLWKIGQGAAQVILTALGAGELGLDKLVLSGGLRSKETLVTNAMSPYAVVATDTSLVIDCTAGNVQVNLPNASGSGAGRVLPIKRRDSTLNTALVVPVGGQFIDGAANLTFNPLDTSVLQAGGLNWRRYAATVFAGAAFVETSDLYPVPEAPTSGNATRVGQTNFDGASFQLRRGVSADRIIFRISGFTAGGTARILIYQGVNGGSGTAKLVASVRNYAPPGTGVQEAAFAEGTVLFQPGLIYVLIGRDSPGNSVTFGTYTTLNLDGVTTAVPSTVHPTAFNTAILSNTAPATVDPLQTPTGQFTGTASDVVPVIRLRHT